MWKVLGEETVIPKMGEVWTERMVQLSKRRKDKDRFISTLRDADVRYLFDSVREVNTFVVTLPPKYGHEDLEFMRAYVKRVDKSLKEPVVEYEGVPQKYTIIFTSDVEEDDYQWRKEHRSDYFKWVEDKSKEEKSEKEEQTF
ncbi:MAG TPA: hypothetical protein VLU38_03400 [Methanomassiliicoccales archaeon]|nr:hypothetical protein [Methanomassiliicoccales archaeon]